MTLVDVFSNGTIHVAVAPAQLPAEMRGKLGVLLHDFQSEETKWLPRVCNEDGSPKLVSGKPYGLPETEKCGDNVFEKIVEPWQWFWFELLQYATPSLSVAEQKKKWSDLTSGMKFKTNKHGWDDGYADYINEVNVTKTPMSWENVSTCGNPVVLTGNKRNIGGRGFTGVWCLDTTEFPPEIIGHDAIDCFIHAATVCRPERGTQANFPRHTQAPNGTFVVNHFPHANGGKVPVPFQSARGAKSVFMGLPVRENWIADWRIAPLDDGEYPVVQTVR